MSNVAGSDQGRGRRGRPRVLVLAARAPWPAITGDRLRAGVWVQALAEEFDVVLLSPRADPPSGLAPFVLRPLTWSPGHLAGAAVRVVREGLPVTTLLTAGYDWPAALRAAQTASGPFDVGVVVLARVHPWAWPALDAPRLVLDAIDSLAANLEERAAEAGLSRPFWRFEARRTRRLEAAVGNCYDIVTVVAEAEAMQLPGAKVVDHGIEIGPDPEPGSRRFDFGFWGRLAYFANRDAARVLLDQVWPSIRKRLPSATLVIGGADAPGIVRSRHGIAGVTVVSPMRDRPWLLRQVRVALFPLRFGTGQSTKLLEAAEAGCAIVALPKGVRGVGELADATVVCDTPESMATAGADLMTNAEEAERLGVTARGVVIRRFDRRAACRRLAELVRGVGEPNSSS